MRLLLGAASPREESELLALLEGVMGHEVHALMDTDDLLQSLQQGSWDACVVSTTFFGLTPELAAHLHRQGVPLVVVGSPDSLHPYRQVALTVPLPPLREAMAAALEAARAAAGGPPPAAAAESRLRPERPEAGEEGRGERGVVLLLVGARGGVGVTTTAMGMAAAAAARGLKVAIVDLDPLGGELLPYLDLDPRRGFLGLVAALAQGVELEDALPGELQPAPGQRQVAVLAGPEDPSHWGGVPPEAVQAAVEALACRFDLVVVDGGQLLPDYLLPLRLEAGYLAAHAVALVTVADIPGLSRARVALERLARYAVAALVLARHTGGHYRPGEVREALELPAGLSLLTVADDPRLLKAARRQQLPRPGGRAWPGFRRLVDLATGLRSPVPRRREGGTVRLAPAEERP